MSPHELTIRLAAGFRTTAPSLRRPVDRDPRHPYNRRLRNVIRGGSILITLVLGCAGRVPQGRQPVNAAWAAAAATHTAPAGPLRIVFRWKLVDRDARFSGRGVTRAASPYRARLDLFGPRGETYLSAALVESALRLPVGTQDAPLPPPALLWAALGVFRQPDSARLVKTERDGATLRLEFARDDEHWSFRFQDGSLRHAEWNGPRQGRRTVELKGTASHGLPSEAVYRDWIAFRELTLTLEEVEQVDGFSPDIWQLGPG